MSSQGITAILLNGGFGTRSGASEPKQFLNLNGIPILAYNLLAMQKVDAIEKIIINYPDGQLNKVREIVTGYAITKPVEYVEAGDTRHASVALMLEHVTTSRVIINEAARPFVSPADFQLLIDCPAKNVSLTLPIPFTVAPVDPATGKITGSLERDKLRNIQLPQKFETAELRAAHEHAKKNSIVFTEDATLVAVAGFDVEFINGPETNFKITTPFDLKLANYMFRKETDRDE